MADRNALEAMLRASPREDSTYLVYADCLQALGDPRGELIALDEAARRAPAAEAGTWRRRRDELLARHPQLAPPESREVQFGWHLGFVRSVRIYDIRFDLSAVFSHPALAYCTSIMLGDWTSPAQKNLDALAPFIPPTLREFALGDPEYAYHRHAAPALDLDGALVGIKLTNLFAACPVQLSRVDRLKSLEIIDHSALTFDLIGRAHGLERLVIRGDDEIDITPFLERKLVELSLLHVPLYEAQLQALAASPLLRHLRVLRLWNAGITPASARCFTREAFGHLELLDLSDAGLDAEVARYLETVANDVRTIPSRVRR